MKFSFKLLLIFYISCLPFTKLSAQNLVLDTTFQPFFNMHTMSSINRGSVNTLWENPKTGRIFIGGSFDFRTPFNIPNPSVTHGGISSLNRDGTLDQSFIGTQKRGTNIIFPINDSVFFIEAGRGDIDLIDTFGKIWNRHQVFLRSQWWYNIQMLTLSCNAITSPNVFFFENGSSLISTMGNCPLILGTDSFPPRHIVKLDSLGLLDTSYLSKPDANFPFLTFEPYDSNRMMIYNRGWRFTHYGSRQVDGICRVFHDGTIDTTFNSPLLPFRPAVFFNEWVQLSAPDARGRFFIHGNFFVKGDTINPHTLIRVNSDGSLDSSFRNFEGPIDSAFNFPPSNNPYILLSSKSVNDIAPTSDGGYLVIGHFDKYQGHPVNNIAKIDSNGTIQPHLINWRGPDSAITRVVTFSRMFSIVASKFGGYYVMGDFGKWNGKKSQPIVRLIESNLLVGLEEESIASQTVEFSLYPNPAKDEVNILLEQKALLKQIEIRDLTGRLLRNYSGSAGKNTYQVVISDLPKGIYLISLRLENGSVQTKKLVKQ